MQAFLAPFPARRARSHQAHREAALCDPRGARPARVPPCMRKAPAGGRGKSKRGGEKGSGLGGGAGTQGGPAAVGSDGAADADADADAGTQQPLRSAGLDDQLLRDAQRLRSRRRDSNSSNTSDSSSSSTSRASGEDAQQQEQGGQGRLRKAVDTLLLWDFFLVLALLAWLLVALVPHFATGDNQLLDAWLALWQPFIQPVLGVLMLGTITQGAMSYFASKE